MPSKPLRLLIPISDQFSVRYSLRTGLLTQITSYAIPVILMRWHDDALKKELEALGAEVHVMPPSHFGRRFERMKRHIDVWHLQRLQSPTLTVVARMPGCR